MKPIVIFLLILSSACILNAQNGNPTTLQRQQITKLINQYAQSRLVNDTLLLKPILTADVDQLISTGEWRIGVKAAVDGMLASSKTNPGSRTLVVEKIRLLTPGSALVDCQYTIVESAQSTRQMNSSFLVVRHHKQWKIAAIRNMLPALR